MKIKEHLSKENLHHAYLLEGVREEILPEVLPFIQSLGVSIVGNPDFCNISIDSFKVEDARNLKSLSGEMSFTAKGKRIFIISANSFLLEAQNMLLKIFEEPIENTHFFVIVPDIDVLLKTLVSRFYLIKNISETFTSEAEKFIKMPLRNRIDFVKELLAETDEDLPAQAGETVLLDSTRAKATKFLNAIEVTLHKKLQKTPVSCFEQIFKVREFLRMPGSSIKSLIESVALVIPVLQ